MKASRLLYGVIILGALAWWLSSVSEGEESKIRSRLEQIRELVSKEPGEKALQSADRARRLDAHLTDPFLLRLDPVGLEIQDATSLVRPFVGLRQSVEKLGVSFSDIEIEIDPGGSTASSVMKATLLAQGGQLRRGSYRVEILWRLEGRWRVEELQATDLPQGSLF